MVVSNPAARHPIRVRRRLAALAVAAGVAAISLSAAPAPEAAVPAVDTTPAAGAVRALTTEPARSAFPHDFDTVAGYRPAVVDGVPLAPHGSCSSPVPLPIEFDNACKAHDLGYDLLRYAQHEGHPLGAWARRDLDALLADRMRAACRQRTAPVARARCTLMARIAAGVVDLNSRRQGYGVPVVEHFPSVRVGPLRPVHLLALLVAVGAALLAWRAGAPGRTEFPVGRPRREFV